MENTTINAPITGADVFKYKHDLMEEVHAVLLEHPDWTPKQISEETGVSPKQVSNWKTNHREQLAQELKKRYGDNIPQPQAAPDPEPVKAEDDPAELRKRLDARDKQLEDLKRQLDTLTTDRDAWQDKVAELADVKCHLEEELRAKKDNDDAADMNRKLAARVSELNNEKLDLLAELAKYKDIIVKLTVKLLEA